MLRPLVEQLKRFDGFGPSLLAPDADLPAVEWTPPDDRRRSRRLIRRRVLPSPGVYGMIDADGELIYVGKSKRLRDRLLSYFSGGAARSKAQRIIRQTDRVIWENAPTELAALVRELELIRRWQPRFNVRGQPSDRRRAYVGLGRGPAPHVYLTTKPSPRDELLFGPVRGVRHYRRVVRLVNDSFQLRDCSGRAPILFSDQLELFGEPRPPRCLRHEFGTCLAPCAAECSCGEYADRVRKARDFLEGRDGSLLLGLETAMRSASAEWQFERAATLRDTHEALAQFDGRLRRIREARRRYTFVYPVPGYLGGESWWLVRRGHLAATCPAPRGRRSARACLDLIERVYATSETNGPGGYPEDLDMLQLVAAWFHDDPEELRRTLSPRAAARICRTKACGGGAAQL